MSFSKLATIYIASPNRNKQRTNKVIYFTPHCIVGQLTAQRCGELFSKSSYQASSNYGIGTDGKIGGYVDEEDRSWCTSSAWNDNRAITVECASDTKHPYAMNQKVWDSLVDLAVDICQRYGKNKMLWFNDKKTALGYSPKSNEMVITAHRWFAAKACVPTNSEVLTRNGWMRIGDIEVGDEIACADIDNLRITFEEVYDKVPVRQQDTYTNNDLTATKDHRMVYCIHKNGRYRIDEYRHLLNDGNQIYIPTAGHADRPGLNITDDMLRFFVAIQADGHYMYDRHVDGSKSYYGVEFHFRKERKIERIKDILDACGFEWVERVKGDGSTSIRVYNSEGVNIVTDICEDFLHDKQFTWECLEMSEYQAKMFIDELLYWDGCEAASLYTSRVRENLDIVSALAAINGIGSKITGSSVYFAGRPYITLGKEPNSTRRNNRQNNGPKTEVTCVSVKTGVFLMRQNGKTFITGNCPGDWLYNRLGKLADEVNKKLNSQVPTPKLVVEDPKHLYIPSEDDRCQLVWTFLATKGLNDYAIAGLMGNLYCESALRPNNLQNSFETKLGMTDKGYTDAVNKGTYKNFIHDGAGYGLAQWTFWSRKQALLYFAEKKMLSIDNLNMQLEFLWEELAAYKHVMDILSKTSSIKEACNVVLREYERPAVVVKNDKAGITKALNARTAAGKDFYDKFSIAGKQLQPNKKSLGYFVQYGAFSTKNNAKKRLYNIQAKDLDGEVVKFDGYYRVIDGYYDTVEEANKIAEKARAAGYNVIIKERLK